VSEKRRFLEKNFKRLNNFPSKCYLKRFEIFCNFRQLLELNIWTAWTIGFKRHEENLHLCFKCINFILLIFFIFIKLIFLFIGRSTLARQIWRWSTLFDPKKLGRPHSATHAGKANMITYFFFIMYLNNEHSQGFG
jgi:hypothetical protein